MRPVLLWLAFVRARRYLRSIIWMVLVSAVSIVAFLIASAYFPYAKPVYVIEAETTAASVIFEGNQNVWSFDYAVACVPLSQEDQFPDLAGSGQGDASATPGDCPAGLARTIAGGRVDLVWPEDFRAELRMASRGRVAITVRAPDDTDPWAVGDLASGGDVPARLTMDRLPDRTVFYLTRRDWHAAGPLTFRGELTLGNDLATGETGYVLGGRYEVRQRPLLYGLGTSEFATIKSGPLLRGERARIEATDARDEDEEQEEEEEEKRQRELQIAGSFSPAADPQLYGFHANAISAPASAVLRTSFQGARVQSLIQPNWIDRVLADPAMLAVIAIIGLFANLTQLLSIFGLLLKSDG
ncbi:MAG: hypothetical protein AAGE18_19210 [Pseudomonadota bacterium]